MNELEQYVKQTIATQSLRESSLSRVYRHMLDHDCAILTASRNDPYDKTLCASPYVSPYEDQELSTHDLNKLNNRDLKAALLKKGYGVTQVDGSFIENYQSNNPDMPPIEVKEDSYFVVNIHNDPSFLDTIINLGMTFCQDAIMFIPQGGQEAFLYGTNNSSNIGLNNKVSLGKISMGKESEFMTRVNGRPFTTESAQLNTYNTLSRLERIAVSANAKRVLG